MQFLNFNFRKPYVWIGSLLALIPGLMEAAEQASPTLKEVVVINQQSIDKLWVLMAAAMVFLMQAGFKCFEVGIVRTKNSTVTGMKNIIDWVICSLIFFGVGFAFMFGSSTSGLIGTSFFALDGLSDATHLDTVFFMFQMAFAGTALTIVSGAMSERTGFIPYLCGSIFIALVIYPIFGHWVWGNLILTDNEPWLASMGFIDFAGSTAVHSLGAWVALVGVWFVGPRLGRYSADGKIREFEAHSYAYAILGVILLWFGWWGFNGGSQLALDGAVGPIITKTNLAGAAAGLAAFFHCMFFQNKEGLNDKLLGGILGGLVAVTACCAVVSYLGAVIVGLGAGVIHNLSYDLLSKKLKLDDPVGAIPVHGFCGAYGTLCVAVFGQQELLNLPRFEQFGVQLLGVVVCFVWSVSTAIAMYAILKHTVGLRVSPTEEQAGLSLAHSDSEKTVSDSEKADINEIKRLMNL